MPRNIAPDKLVTTGVMQPYRPIVLALARRILLAVVAILLIVVLLPAAIAAQASSLV
jgi:hypothetical protein